ncbi:hypothetical protein UFOVP1169_40 [uncultured Caudovirales phage]|uniref:Uncharacterized protein n=1 Tax=uncultured Caudovirales phage TaxID=2100421 RepID=A0A6J5QTM6_9CAUD|nr:hypothetical protein UFOVP1169_40 [uncultured Caudovirales phage]
MSLVRENLLTRKGYTPYCGGDYSRCRLPRLVFDGDQFKCPHGCGFRTNYDPEFIEQYKAAQKMMCEPTTNQEPKP